MSKRPPVGTQVDSINRNSPFVQVSFNAKAFDNFVTGLGVDFIHYKAMPSPIGLKDRGDYRRSDGVDTITSNGSIYRCAGKFTATITDNNRSSKYGTAGIEDPAESRIVLPRFYNTATGVDDADRIYLLPGDRLYIADPDADVSVANSQWMDYIPNADNVPMFPICKLDGPIVDSRNFEYKLNVDFNISCHGNIHWIPGANNPGIDPETGKGRIYSVRYLYRAFYYVLSLPKEVRITNLTNSNVRSPERMPYYAVIVREYLFHNENKGNDINQNKTKTPARTVQAPVDAQNPDKYPIIVDLSGIGDDDSQS